MTTEIANVEMAAAWDGEEGDNWVEHADFYEKGNTHLRRRLVDGAAITPSARVLDIGCGTGQSTRDAARVAASALGVDLSSKMLERARKQSADEGLLNVEFVQADAQVHPFEAGTFDVAISSFGVMFFNDPVAAFANIGRALVPGGRIAFMAWRGVDDNEWLNIIRTSLAMGRPLFVPPPDAPTPFSLADATRVEERFTAAGFTGIELEPIDETMWFGDDLDTAWNFFSSAGLVKGLTEDLDAPTRQQALDNLRAAIESKAGPDGFQLQSAAWLITATKP